MRKKLVVFGPVEGDHLNLWLPPFTGTYDIHVLTLHPHPQAVPGVTYHTVPRPTGTKLDFLLTVPFIARWMRRMQPDLLHVHFLSSYGLAAALAGPCCPRLLSVWGSDVNKTFPHPLWGPLCRWAARQFGKINVPSHDLERKLAEAGIPVERLAVFQYGVKTENLPRRTPDPSRRRLKLVSFRDWAPLYRIENVVEMFARDSESHDDLELHLLGRSTPEQNRRIMDLVQSSPHPERIHVHGFLPYAKLFPLLAEMDLMISIPTMDGMPLSLLESNWIGQWPILSRIPANVEWSGPEGAEYLSDLTPREFRRAVDAASVKTMQPESLELLRRKVLANGDYSTNMRRLGGIYEALLAGNAGQA